MRGALVGREPRSYGYLRKWYGALCDVRSGDTPTDRARDILPCLADIVHRLWLLFAVVPAAKEVVMPRNMQRKGQPLCRAGMVMEVYLSHSTASDVSDAGQSGIVPVQRREA